MRDILQRIDRFLDLFDRYVKIQDEELARAKVRDDEQRIFFQRQAEAAENIASASNAQTHTARRTATALEESVKLADRDPR